VTDLRAFFTLCGLAFLAMASYAFARPPAESLFLAHYTKAGLPLVWLAVAFTVLVTVAVYNRYTGRVPLGHLMAAVSWLSAILLAVLLGLHAVGVPHVPFALYVWKDVYIVVMVETFWTFANCTSTLRQARWTYGLFLCAGGLGGICANLLVGALAERFGTAAAMAASALDLAIVGTLAWVAAPSLGADIRVGGRQPSLAEGVRAFSRSRMLPLLLALIVVTQLAITLIDYDFNAILEQSYPEADARTKVIGGVYARIDALQIVLQLAAGPIFRLVGIDAVLVIIPLVLGTALGSFLVAPSFGSIAVAKVASKVFDYSLFRAAKEMLYIPLSLEEKTRGKAIVDIFGYRVAKGGVSLLLLGIGSVAAGVPTRWTLVLLLVWLALVAAVIGRRDRVAT
jgi:ATP:ADP antiporter, AAA family